MKEEYYMLKSKEEIIRGKMKTLIIKAITEHNGRITFKKEEDDDEYPLTTLLSGSKDIYFISITDVYLDEGGVRIYADGIDDDSICRKTGFEIEEERYSDILFFIAYVLEWNKKENTQEIKDNINSTIMEMACELAEKEMSDGYGKLPEYFMNKDGGYTDFYQNIFNPIYDKYYNRIAELADFEYE
ncbi:hypothetical protein [Dysgonomonas sp. ZJ709]|uniref:hypothetical protein n=1 Tax=Dysgonomonas sp. ZJ709 TaxID=2709797 RepID=UPI0013EB2E3C|nr:hypothetical protein [Dysgonomonas sp. ZJ709]